jgi:hypothetical protein
MKGDRERNEDAAIHRSRCAVAEATAGLKRLGLYQMTADGQGGFTAVELDPAQRRELLVFLSELDELVKGLDAMKAELARDIQRTNNNMSASAAYRHVGTVLRQSRRQSKH